MRRKTQPIAGYWQVYVPSGYFQQKVEALQETLAKADALVESFEQRQAKLTEVYDQAEKMLEEVSRIKEALTFDNKLRERIEATIARTKNLRRGVKR